MRSLLTKRKALGGWRATQGEIPVTGMRSIYRAERWVQSLFSRAVWNMEQRLAALDIEIERRAQK
jgi:hypothetical protein